MRGKRSELLLNVVDRSECSKKDPEGTLLHLVTVTS